jgi:hypothetical protein
MSANQELIPAEDAKRLVTRFLIELIGYNLSANMEELAHAMSSASPDTSPLSSTPSVEETDELHELASLTTLLHEMVDTNDINSVSKTERQLPLPQNHPARGSPQRQRCLCTQSDRRIYRSQCAPTKQKKTHLGWATPLWPFIWFFRFATADVLFTFSQNIFNISPNERVQFVLGAALRKYQISVFVPGKMNLLG